MCRREDSINEDHDKSDDADSEIPSPTLSEFLEREEDLEVERIANDLTLTDADKIDAIAKVRSLCWADTTLIDSYLSNQLTLADVVEKIAAPIDEAYTTTDHGSAYSDPEQDARDEDEWNDDDSPEEAPRIFGPAEDFPQPEGADELLTTDGPLWDLGFMMHHSSKKIPWDDDAQQNKLMKLVEAFRARPDPPPPERMTLLQRDWIWKTGTLWSELDLLALSSRDVWNSVCGVGSGFTPVEQRAWTNVNAFWARLVVSGMSDYQVYGLWALRDALEDIRHVTRMRGCGSAVVERRSCYVKVAAVWILVAGRRLYHCRVVEQGGGQGDGIDLDLEDDGRLPWYGTEEWTDSRWTYWRRMFEKLSREDVYTVESRELAARAAREIAALQVEQ